MKQLEANKKELLAINHNMLKGLHDIYRFDYNALYTIRKHTGRFTVKSLIKNGYIPEDIHSFRIVLLIKRPYCRTANSLYSVRVTSSGELETDIKASYVNGVDKYWRKLDFNDDRKCDETITYIVIQRCEDLTPVKQLEDRPTERAHLVFCPKREENEKDGYKVFRDWENGEHNRTWNYRWYTADNMSDSIDKSGYYLQPVRVARQRRAEEIRRNRAGMEYLHTDNTAKIEELKAQIKLISDAIKMRVQFAETAVNWVKIARVVNDWGSGFPHLFESVEKLEKNEREKAFENQQAFMWKYNDIKNDLADICKKLFADN